MCNVIFCSKGNALLVYWPFAHLHLKAFYYFCIVSVIFQLLVFTWRQDGHVDVLSTKKFWLVLLFGTPTWPLCLLFFMSLGIVWKPRIEKSRTITYDKENHQVFLTVDSTIFAKINVLLFSEWKALSLAKTWWDFNWRRGWLFVCNRITKCNTVPLMRAWNYNF